MKDLQKFLIEALQKRFSADATIRAIEKQIKQTAEETTLEKYRNYSFSSDGLEFELGGVHAFLCHWGDSLALRNVELTLVYFCTSELPKEKIKRLKEVKDMYKKEKNLPHNTYKVPIWHELTYEIDIESVLSGYINLIINEK